METTLIIENKTGLHARPASMFVQEANKFSSKIKLTAKGKTVDAKSILMIMSLGLTQVLNSLSVLKVTTLKQLLMLLLVSSKTNSVKNNF